MMNKQVKLETLSVFFPAYNEEANIEAAVGEALAILPQVAQTFEVIVINDGSRDRTAERVKKIASHDARVRLVTQKNKGYGGALKRGFKEARYEWIFFTDSDLQFRFADLRKLVDRTPGNKLVIGYRKKRAEGYKRQLLAKMLKIWNRVLLRFPWQIRDIDCAFKLIHRSVFETIGPLWSDGAMVSTELLLKAYRAKLPFEQVGVKHFERRAGTPTGNNRKVIARAVRDTFMLRKQFFLQSQLVRKTRKWIKGMPVVMLVVGFFIGNPYTRG